MEQTTLMTQVMAEQYCSIDTKTLEGQIMAASAITAPDYNIGDHVGATIRIKDVYAQRTEFVDDETGEITPGIRTVLIDVYGKSYQTASMGIFNSLKQMFAIFGQPTWTPGVLVQVISKNIGKNRVYMLKPVAEAASSVVEPASNIAE